MKFIDIENWERKDHFNYFKNYDYPHFNICGNIDITVFFDHIKKTGLPFFISMLYLTSRTANDIREFRLRIKWDKLVEYSSVSPSCTVMTSSDAFSYCTIEYKKNYHEFLANAQAMIEKAKQKANIDDVPDKDDLIYVTSIPWISFTSISHAMHTNPADSIPRIGWGKYFEENGKLMLPLSVSAHHALVDGLHIGRYFNILQEYLNNPENSFTKE